MTRAEQEKMIAELASFTGNMSREDLSEFEMLRKRNKDDEDLDSLSRGTLERLHGRYAKRKSKQDAEEIWKKLTSNRK